MNPAERHFGVLVERMDKKIDLVLEGHTALDVKFTKKFDELHDELVFHREILRSHSGILKSHSEMIASVKEDTEILKEDSASIKHDLKRKIDREEFAALERRVALLERRRS